MVGRVDAQLVVHAFYEEEDLVLLDSDFVIRAWLGLVVVDGLEDGEVTFWIVGHVGGGVRLRSQSRFDQSPFASIPYPCAFFLPYERRRK